MKKSISLDASDGVEEDEEMMLYPCPFVRERNFSHPDFSEHLVQVPNLKIVLGTLGSGQLSSFGKEASEMLGNPSAKA